MGTPQAQIPISVIARLKKNASMHLDAPSFLEMLDVPGNFEKCCQICHEVLVVPQLERGIVDTPLTTPSRRTLDGGPEGATARVSATLAGERLSAVTSPRHINLDVRLVLGCINADFGKQIVILQHFSRSTRFAHFCTARNSHFWRKLSKFSRNIFVCICQNFRNFEKICEL